MGLYYDDISNKELMITISMIKSFSIYSRRVHIMRMTQASKPVQNILNRSGFIHRDKRIPNWDKYILLEYQNKKIFAINSPIFIFYARCRETKLRQIHLLTDSILFASVCIRYLYIVKNCMMLNICFYF